ncbi:hypothetical protein L207DRAFT_512952 [Hyaloscypha variabilis F]|uniref:Uncharacterized protein n=1 Tax=Hyaloscypha variabilis (strain UAMH 11265 / GT02V1 / F) TaxID=1149755 RepID=A0A2J6RNB9_HYAVF|nr:hypothetical protein L207DRAFT_512952 [Hyaloscypha variabilis F]
MVLLSYCTGAKSSSFEDDLEDKDEQQQRWPIVRWRREGANVQQRKIGRDLAPKLSKPSDYLVGIGLLLLVTYEL